MFQTGSRLLIGATVSGDGRRRSSTASPRAARSARRGWCSPPPRSPAWPASTCSSATATCRRWTRRRPTAVRGGSATARRVAVAAHRRRSARCWSSSASSATRWCSSSASIALLAATAEWMVQAWSERASADGELQRGRPHPHQPPARVPGAGRRRRRHHHLLVQPDHAVPVEDRAAPSPSACRRPRPGPPGSSSPSGRPCAGADRRRRRHRRPRSDRRAARSPPSRASVSCTRTRRSGDLAVPRGVRHDRRDRGRRERLAERGRQGQHRRRVVLERGRHAGRRQRRRRRRPGRLHRHRAPPRRTSCSSTTAPRTAGSSSTSARSRPRSTRRRAPIDDTTVPFQYCTALVEDGGSAAPDVLDPDRQRLRRRRPT